MPNFHDELEWETRKERIDKTLARHWSINKYSSTLDVSSLTNHAIMEHPTANGPADYIFFVNGKPLAVLEAKKVSTAAQEVLGQAKRYSRGLVDGIGNWDGYRIPLLYSSNGEVTWFVDVRDSQNIRRKTNGVHAPSAMLEMLERNTEDSINKLKSSDVSENERLRPYQVKAIAATESAIVNKKREMLIAMATGTGKTFLTVSQVYRLLSSGLFRRILFLVDRKALAAQAVRAFASFDTPHRNKFNQEYEVYSQAFQRNDVGDDEPFKPNILPYEYLTNPTINHTFVYVCTIQRMAMNLYGRETVTEESLYDAGDVSDALDIPIHAFDLIIADECHRGYTAKETSIWRNTLEHFDCVKIGLTATPAPHSLALFKEVVYRYTTQEAIDDGWLVDYEAVAISSDVKINGVFLHEGEPVGVVDAATGAIIYDELEDEREYAAPDVERKITVPDTNKKIIEELKLYTDKFEEENGRFPKTLIFAVNDIDHRSHADQVVRLCREIFNRGDAFAEKITGNANVDRPLQRIREFRNRPNPRVVVTVDMLSTGVDIPALEFIVFMRPVQSRILWTQMLGRGTRICPDIHKTHFTIFDCFGGTLIEYFKNTNEFAPEPPQKDVVPIEKVIENIWQNVDRGYNVNVLIKRLHRIDKNMTGDAREKFAYYIADGDMGRFASQLKKNLREDFSNTMKILRDKDFQELLTSYQRMKYSFVITEETVDTVTSEWVFKIGGESVRPEDYLLMFERFVKENPEQIEAIDIILHRPKDWRTDMFNELRVKMKKSIFKENDLQKAHSIVNNKALADIISMIKHAAEKQAPLYTAHERIENVMRTFMRERDFSEEQIRWLELIRNHLVENLTIDVDDFEHAPIFTRMGGKSKAKRVFGGELDSIVSELNGIIAA